MTGGEDYVVIRATFRGVSRSGLAIKLKTEDAEGWVALSCVHCSTDELIERIAPGYEGDFKIMRWVAEKEGFL